MEFDEEFDEGRSAGYQQPFCVACGVMVSTEDDLADYDGCEHEGRELSLLWTSRYRAIVSDKPRSTHQGKQNLRLSGISRLPALDDILPPIDEDLLPRIVFYIPRDKEKAVTKRSQTIGKSRKSTRKTEAVYQANFWDKRNRDLYPHGFPVHANCWDMVRWIIGKNAEDELDVLLEVLHQRWQTEPPPFELGTWVQGRWWGPDSSAELEEIDRKIELRALWDPMDIPEVLSVIRRYTHKRPTRPRTRSHYLDKFDLPLDVLFQIMDCLHATEIESFLTATPWHAPDSYWRSRFPRRFIPEADELITSQAENVDWQLLCLEVEKLIENDSSLGIQSRQRIFRILEVTKNLFQSRLSN